MTAVSLPVDLAVSQGEVTHSLRSALADIPPVPAGGLRAALHVEDSVMVPAALEWLHSRGLQGAFLHAEWDLERARAIASSAGCAAMLEGRVERDRFVWKWHRLEAGAADCWPDRTPGLLLLTSGSTGEPKRVFHPWQSLFESVAIRPALAGSCWMTLYPLSRFAGLNTLLHAWLNEAKLVIPSAFTSRALGDHMVRWQPTHLSGTPTLWRTILMQVPRSDDWCLRVRQITLGGETVDQAILDLLAGTFPNARLTHIYASTEAGVCLSVSDAKAGFPAVWLDDASRPVQLRLTDGELFVRRTGSRSRVLDQTADGWWPTRDRIQIDGGRAYFLGRDTDLLNIGGAKVAPAAVEACICEVEGVSAARVSGRKSSFAGTLVAAQVIAAAGSGHDELRGRIVRHCRAKLASYAVPRLIEFVTELPVSASGKLDRQGVS